MSGQDIKELLAQIRQDNSITKYAKQDKAEYDPQKNNVRVYYKTKSHLMPAKFRDVKKKLTGYSSKEISLFLTQADHFIDFENDGKLLEKHLKDYCILKHPTVAPFLASAGMAVADGQLKIVLENEMARGLFDTMELKELLTGYMKDAYEKDMAIVVSVSEKANGSYEIEEDVVSAIDRQKQEREQMQVPKAAMPKAKARPATTKKKVSDTPATQIANLQLEEPNCVIDGEVVFAESQPLKDGTLIKHIFIVCDYTGSVSCFFLESSKYPCKLELPKKGTWVRVEGQYAEDSFARENTIKVKNIGRSAHRSRQDNAETKRVELHVHTQMSAQDGVTPVDAIVKRAGQWGHKAIAITDHGVVQAFPDAEKAAKTAGVKIIYGVEGYMIDDTQNICPAGEDISFDAEYVVFDIETTGLSPRTCDITEIGAVRVVGGELRDTFQSFVKPSAPIPPSITAITGITDDMVKDAPLPEQVLKEFYEFCGDAVLVAHNAPFDSSFVFGKAKQFGILFPNKVVDTLPLCRLAYPDLKNHKLDTVAKHLRIPLAHHRALNDAQCTAKLMLECFRAFQKSGAASLGSVDDGFNLEKRYKHEKMYHIILLSKNKRGLRNLYKLISHAHVDYFYRKPRMPKSLIDAHREGLIIGSACESGELYTAVVGGASEKRLEEIASFYDFLEIQPQDNNSFLVRKNILPSMEHVRNCNRKVVELGEKLDKPVVATCDVHFLDPHGEMFRRIIFKVQGYDDTEQAPLYLRTTEEMLEEFSYLGKEKAYEVVVENSNKIADMTEETELFQNETAMPAIENASEKIVAMAYDTAREIYGDPLPEIVEQRLKRELDSIVGHGFSVLYYSAHKLVKKSLEDGYLVGSRGSVGSSLAATMTGITEVNPLPPHYICPNCKQSDFDVDREKYTCGVDLPEAVCPACGTQYKKDGFDIPFEVFLGIDADKVPDIDLNFSGEYQNVAHKYTEELFGEGHVFRAGTISTVKDNIAFGYVSKYLEQTGTYVSEAEKKRLIQGIAGAKKTTGQHPGGMVIVPHDREVYEFTPVQRPADKQDAEFITTHFDFNSMHDILIKLDILGHDVPTIIRLLQDMTGIDPLEIPLDDPETMQLFSSLKPLGIKPVQLLGIKTGTLGVPEMGTRFVRQMLMDTMPTTMGEIVRISGLSHGTDVWIGNAQELIAGKTCTLREAICTRDDIMNYLVAKGVEKRMAFFIMEAVRKGQIAKKGFSAEQEQALKDAKIPEWFIGSCRKIKYMFPKAHAVAYVIMAMRIAYCKVHHKEAFYASYFTVRAGEFDGSSVLEGVEGIKKQWHIIEEKGNNATANEKNMAVMLEVACEMYLRGVHFLPVDLAKSDAIKYSIEETGIRMPFLAIPKLGDTAARAIAVERDIAPFISVEDLKKRAKVSSAVIEEMQKMGTLAGMPESNQLSLFDF